MSFITDKTYFEHYHCVREIDDLLTDLGYSTYSSLYRIGDAEYRNVFVNSKKKSYVVVSTTLLENGDSKLHILNVDDLAVAKLTPLEKIEFKKYRLAEIGVGDDALRERLEDIKHGLHIIRVKPLKEKRVYQELVEVDKEGNRFIDYSKLKVKGEL